MGSSDDTSAAASLEAKLRSFIENLTDAEAGALTAMIAVDGAEVAGFDQANGVPTLPSFNCMVSNIMKTKHDTVKNSISNVR